MNADNPKSIAPTSFKPSQPKVESNRSLKFRLIVIAIALPLLLIMWFLFSAKSVKLVFVPAAQTQALESLVKIKFGGVYLLSKGNHQVTASTVGYQPLSQQIQVGDERNQTVELVFEKLPGRVSLSSVPNGAQVKIDGEDVGITPIAELLVAAGNHQITYELDRYQGSQTMVEVTGLDQAQSFVQTLPPDWAEVEVVTEPRGAKIWVDNVDTGLVTPDVAQILAGERDIRISLAGHKSYRRTMLITAGEPVALSGIKLEQADGLVTITTAPSGAGITVDGEFQGPSPVELALKSGQNYKIQAFKSGYGSRSTTLKLAKGETRGLTLKLTQQLGKVQILAEPADAELFVNDRPLGNANQIINLPTRSQTIEIKLAGHAGYTTKITPKAGLTQEVKVRLLSLAEARIAALQPTVTNSQKQQLVLVTPGALTMGASRREPGRRANETLREVSLTRLFYLSRFEVTNKQFRAFASGHDSGSFEEQTLNKDDQPVVNVSWLDGASYCNWLSKKENLPPYYQLEFGKYKGVNPQATGYRLPTEAEWAWSVRQVKTDTDRLNFPWGSNLPPPDRHGNYADRSAAHLVGRIIFGYNDNHLVAAPVGTYAKNELGIHDLGGNVAEWISDFYELPKSTDATLTDPTGPTQGEYHVIKGSSWMHGTITDLRITYRDYGIDGREDLGFRLARYAESK